MSTIKLGQINIDRSVRSYDTYVACICRSDSGFLRPYMATSTLEVETYFGSFPYKGMLCKFIDDGIPVLLLPMLTPMSETNRCSLRLNDTSISPCFPYAYPKFGRRYDSGRTDTAPPDGDVASGKSYYVHVLDFAKVTKEALSDYYSYVITRIGDSPNRVVIYPQIEPSGEGQPTQPVVQQTFYDYRIPVHLSEEDTKASFIKTVKDCANGLVPVKGASQGEETNHYIKGAECLDIFDIVVSNVMDFFFHHDIRITREDYDGSYSDSDGRVAHHLYPSFDAYKEAKWGETRLAFRSWLAEKDYFLCDTMLAVSCCTAIFDDMALDGEAYREFDSSSDTDAYIGEFKARLKAVPDDGSGYEWYARDLPYYSLYVRNRTPMPLLDFYNLEGFSTFTVQSPNMDAIASSTEGSKIVEFYSKTKGSRGGAIAVEIEKYGSGEYDYRLTLTSGEYKEILDVTTASESGGRIHLNKVGTVSALVEAKLYNYRLSNGRYICTDDFEDEAPEGEAYDGDNVMPRILPEGKWTLGRHSKEVFDYESACSTLDVLSDSEYYPDFLLVNELDYGSDRHWEQGDGGTMIAKGEDRNYDYVKRLAEYASSKNTQVLVRVEEFHYNPPAIVRSPSESFERIPMPLEARGGRMLYFNGCFRHNGVLFPCFYPYAVNFIKGDFIKRLPYGVLYDVEDKYDKKLLADKGINFLEYDNYSYCYKTVREPGGAGASAIVRFVASKISRVFLSGKYDFIGTTQSELPSIIANKVSKAKSLLPILGGVEYGYDVDGTSVSIIVAFSIPSLVNKEFRLNITLTTT